ncbi:hypothetical protein VZ52_02070 [Ralstonia mannitolilytica]|nr:hypothetical protein VZ52_02070 [Ralstonia mannitolilytica]
MMMTRRNRQLLISIASVLVPAALVAIAGAMHLPPAQFYSVSGAFVQLGALFFVPYLLCLAISHFARTYWGVFALVPLLGLEAAYFAVMPHLQRGVTSNGDAVLEFLAGFAGFTVVWAIALGVLGVLLMLVAVSGAAMRYVLAERRDNEP